MWDFSTDPEFQKKLDWMDAFIRDEVEPLELVWGGKVHQGLKGDLRPIIEPLKDRVKEQGLWACHLGPELGGQGYGQLKLALMNELIGRSHLASFVFGCQAPDTGNAEIIAMFGTDEQKERYLTPLLDGRCFSAFSMTEQTGGADPRTFRCAAFPDGDGWVIRGEKYFTSNADIADFLIVMAVTDPDADPRRRMSMFLVPTDTPGIEILRNVATMGERSGQGHHAHIRYDDVRVGADALLGERGGAFAVSQARLGGGRIHHAMRTVAAVKLAFDMMCERALSREVYGGRPLASKQLVQSSIADSYIQIQQFRLMILHTAWLIDQSSTKEARTQIAACKVAAARVFHDVVYKAMHLHGALGVSTDTPLARLWQQAPLMGIMDGPTEVHQSSMARRILADYEPSPTDWPTQYLPDRREAARAKYAGPAPT
ncbi:acyl-CoA dehydrogenase family protein [Actinocorallia sp. A-T 12471]|uniref:acyl-CoA dehydrogenase family protein n=1 Tax=Actinocorallia sp. A-T 12471 TaxID=3089813 RepID=UPI0029D0F8DD|nr:acyl-CoA dehydrogenase family protein [Actinocorallia sp. A-T 12471]MDX6743891.1 acyl-CoA dehydrogenase family protein [Actinocorallia sp. A-T 12471]